MKLQDKKNTTISLFKIFRASKSGKFLKITSEHGCEIDLEYEEYLKMEEDLKGIEKWMQDKENYSYRV